MAIEFQRHLWSADDFEAMVEAGILTDEHRVELLGGEIVEMPPPGPPHCSAVDQLTMDLAGELRGVATVRVQGSVRLDDRSIPEPDLAILRHPPGHYRKAHPRPADILLIVEVADTSLLRDRNLKLPFYARAGIAEVWLVDVNGEAVERFTEPAGGAYQTAERFGRGTRLTVPGFPHLTVSVDDLFGEPE